MTVIMNYDDLRLHEGYMREALNMVKPPCAPERSRLPAKDIPYRQSWRSSQMRRLLAAFSCTNVRSLLEA